MTFSLGERSKTSCGSENKWLLSPLGSKRSCSGLFNIDPPSFPQFTRAPNLYVMANIFTHSKSQIILQLQNVKSRLSQIMVELELKPFDFKFSQCDLGSHDESSLNSVKDFEDIASHQNKRRLSFPGIVLKLL